MTLFVLAAIFLLIIIGLFVLSGDTSLKTETGDPAEVQGTYTLLLYGSGASNDLVNIAILDKEGDAYSFEIYAPDFAYTVQAGRPAVQALQEAERFVRRNIEVERTRLHKVLSPTGAEIGFELRPLYSAAKFGKDDVLAVRYSIRDRRISVHIVLDAAIEKQSAN